MGTGKVGKLWRARTHRRRTAVVALLGMGVVVGALLFPLAAPAHDASDFFVFARAEFGNDRKSNELNCDASNDKQADVSGSKNTIHGRIHSNADVVASSGATNVFQGEITFGTHDEDCQEQSESNNTYNAGQPGDIDGAPSGVNNGWPGDLDQYVVGGLTIDSVGDALPGETCDVGSLSNSSTITLSAANNGQVVCNGSGETKLDVNNVTMAITILSHGPIVFSGQHNTLTPASHGILAFTDYQLDVAIKLAGSNFMVPQAAIFFSPRGGIDTSGSDDSEQCIQLIGQGPIRVPGSKNVFGPGSAACTAQPPNVSVSKTPDGQTINAGQPATFAITVTNNGPGESTVTLTDNLPVGNGGLDWSEASDPSNACSVTPLPANPQVLSCNFGVLLSGQSRTVSVTTQTDTADCATLNNTVTITPSGDQSPGNNSDTGSITVACPDVSVQKTPDAGTVNAGTNAVFSMTVTNNGPGAAANVTLNDPLPNGGLDWSITSQPAGNPCSITGPLGTEVLACNFGTVNQGDTRTVQVSTPTLQGSGSCGVKNNVATVGATGDSNSQNNTDAGQITVSCPDIGVTKEGNGTISVGGVAQFTMVITNNGPGTATGVTLNDDLPGAGWTIFSQTGGACQTAGGGSTLSCTNLTLGAAAQYSVVVQKTTAPADCGPLPNTVTVSATNEGTNQQNNSANATVTVTCPDVSVQKTPDSGSVDAGGLATFSITVTNNGPGSASNVTLNDPLPNGGLDWSIASQPAGDPCSITGPLGSEVLACNFGTVADDDSRTVQVSSPTVQGAGSCGLKNNVATAGATGDTNSQNNTDAGSITINCPDVSVSKTPDGAIAQAGDSISFTILVKNNGPGTASAVTLTDTLPAGFEWQLSGTDAAACQPFTSPNLSCAFGSLAQGAERTVTLTSATQAADCGNVVNTASISSTGDTNSQNNSDQGSITIQCPDVSVLKTPDAGTVDAGQTATFSITVTNNGPGAAADVTLTDNLPNGGLDWSISLQPAGDPCGITGSPGSEVLSCNFGTLPDDATRTVTVSTATSSAACGAKPNSVTVSATGDVTAANNTDGGQITIACPDVSVAKTPNEGSADAGDDITFSIVVTNNGPGSAADVTLTDNLPNGGLDWSLASQPVGNPCQITGSPGSEVLSCDFGTLPDDATRTVTVTSDTDAGNCGDVDNTATVSATGDTNPQNDSDSGSITVECPEISVVKTGNGTIDAGDDAEFTIVITNNGPGQATGVGLSDDLPGAGWSIDDQTGDDCSVDGTGSVLTCSGISLGVESSYEIVVSKPTTPADCGTLLNNVSVSAENEPEDSTENNSDSATVTVQCPDVVVTKVGNGTIAAGGVAEFTMVITNNGPGEATGVTLTDDLPSSGWEIASQSGSACSVAVGGGSLSCSGITLADEASYTVVVRKTTTTADCGPLPNTVTVDAANEAEAQAGNNSASATITVVCPQITGQGSIDVQKSADPTSVKEPGGPVDFTVTITNTSSLNVTITNVVDSVFGDLDDDGGSGVFDVPINLVPGEKVSKTFQRQVTGVGGQVHTNVVTASGTDAAGNPVSDSDDARVEITPRLIDLVIVKTASSPTPLNGIVNYTMTVTNKGPDTATNVQLADPAPSGITYLTVNPSKGTCNLTASLITCSLGNLAAGETATINVTARATAVGTHTNVATVTGGGGRETNPADNVDDAVTIVPAPFVPPTKPKPEIKPVVCLTLTVTPKMIKADGRPDRVSVKVTAGNKRVKGTKVTIYGAGVRKSGRSNGKGMAFIRINPKKPGLITITALETNQRVCGPKRIGVVGVFLPPLTG